MKKIVIILVIVFVMLAGLGIGFLIYSERMMIQMPVLVQKNPKITFVIGNAWHRSSSSDKWEVAIVGQTLHLGSEVKTEANSQMDIRFHEEMAIHLSEKSFMRLDDMTVKKVTMQLNEGSMYGRFEKLFKDYDITVKTPTTIAAIRGTELGFEIEEEKQAKNKHKDKTLHGKAQPQPEEESEPEPMYITTVFSLSGITELSHTKFQDQKILLSQQNKLKMKEDEPPANPEKLTEEEQQRMRSILNAIHFQEVLFISDKINFEVGSATILPESYPELEKIAAILKEKKVRVRIEGHTDSQGTASLNQTLSIKRADSIRKYLVNKGIDPSSMEIAGYGSSKPVASNDTKEGRALNRRVEFIIIE